MCFIWILLEDSWLQNNVPLNVVNVKNYLNNVDTNLKKMFLDTKFRKKCFKYLQFVYFFYEKKSCKTVFL